MVIEAYNISINKVLDFLIQFSLTHSKTSIEPKAIATWPNLKELKLCR
jgi:hypothetical protein